MRMAKVSTVALSAQDELKKQAAHRACEYVKSGMVLGLGTGSTTAFAVDRIGELLKSGELKDIIGVPTSVKTYEQAASTLFHARAACFVKLTGRELNVKLPLKQLRLDCMLAPDSRRC